MREAVSQEALNQKALNQEAVNYFSRPGFRRLFLAAKRKYETLGRIGGEVRLSSLTPEEQEALSGLLARDLSRQTSVTVQLSDLEEKLRETRFAIGLLDLLQGLYGEAVKPNALKKQEQEEKWKQWIGRLRERARHPSVRLWLSRLEEGQGQGYRTLREWFAQGQGNSRDGEPEDGELLLVVRALERLPVFAGEAERLPIFAAGISGDPHFLDRDRWSGRLFYYGMLEVTRHWRFSCGMGHPERGERDLEKERNLESAGGFPDSSEGAETVPFPESADTVREQYSSAGLLLDDLSSFVFIAGVDPAGEEYSYGLTLRMAERWGEKELLQAAGKMGNGKMENGKMDRNLADASRPLECFLIAALSNGKVYVTENPSICSGILDLIKKFGLGTEKERGCGKRRPLLWSPLICTSGQPSHAALRLFDALARMGIKLYYSGDFDVKGLEIAAALQGRYPDAWQAWGLKEGALLSLKEKEGDGRNGRRRFLALTQEERSLVERLDIRWDENLLSTLGHDKVFEEMVFSYLWKEYLEGHLHSAG
ncbi:TIGR02679 domain-containing protein [Bacillaceae bacterium]